MTAAEWTDCLNTEGESLPSCCANISRVRDILFGVLRNDKMIRVDDLKEAVYLLTSHHDKPNKVQQKIIDAWAGPVGVEAEADLRNLGANKYDPDNLRDAVQLIEGACGYLAWDHFGGDKNRRQKLQSNANWRWQFYRMFPAFTRIMKVFEGSDLQKPVKGWALCEADQMMELNTGLAIFPTEKEANEILEDFTKRPMNDRSGKKRVFSVRKVLVSLKDGVTYLP